MSASTVVRYSHSVVIYLSTLGTCTGLSEDMSVSTVTSVLETRRTSDVTLATRTWVSGMSASSAARGLQQLRVYVLTPVRTCAVHLGVRCYQCEHCGATFARADTVTPSLVTPGLCTWASDTMHASSVLQGLQRLETFLLTPGPCTLVSDATHAHTAANDWDNPQIFDVTFVSCMRCNQA
jgi:hypothetical protein